MHAVEGKDFEVKEDPRLGAYGETNYENQTIKINPVRGDVINSIIHEKLHAENPDMPHDEVYRKAYEIESNMSVRDMRDLLSETVKEIEAPAIKIHHTVSSKVVKQEIK